MTKTLQVPTVQRSKRGPTMAVILRDVPPTYNWGWFSREDPRMHLQPVDKDHRGLPYKVWLENNGRRVIEPEPGIPAKVWKSLQPQILRHRDMIDAWWLGFMIDNHWLELRVVGPRVTLIAYPNYPHRFTRMLNLADYIGNPETLASIGPGDVVFNKEYALLEVFPKRHEARRHHIRLEPILWT